MAKDKSKGGVPNKHVHARISYLQQAATYLAIQGPQPQATSAESEDRLATEKPAEVSATVPPKNDELQAEQSRPSGGLPQYLSDHLVQVARKTQIRLHLDVKHSICKRCGNTLVDGKTSTKSVENLSKGGKKPHADVMVVECSYCGAKRRFPVSAQRQKKKSERPKRVQLGASDEGVKQAATETG
ncbi:hypothetical protein LTR09_002939 [Extremus antarcticus]|uniref:Rpr2-domain-containing protein n=1 Tax=Extremus antarcticus TaxID=702011 RepID=A0AAJ0GFB1_9PEZI|nr:hypothetical protein LTR09_002939 [Extremus antarcticus]